MIWKHILWRCSHELYFEDHPDDSLSRLFKNGYLETVSFKFIYAKSVSNVNEIVKQKLRKATDEIIYIFMDLVPNNINLVQVYKKLSKKSQKSNYRIIVFPLVCAEYYLYVHSKHTILDKEATNLCIISSTDRHTRSLSFVYGKI